MRVFALHANKHRSAMYPIFKDWNVKIYTTHCRFKVLVLVRL